MITSKTRLLLRARDISVLAQKMDLSTRDIRQIMTFARDMTADAAKVLARDCVLPTSVRPIIGLLQTIVRLTEAP